MAKNLLTNIRQIFRRRIFLSKIFFENIKFAKANQQVLKFNKNEVSQKKIKLNL